ncbi:MAG: hypothetical protein LBI33_03335 [Propionibacteriaceae bacterium]|nr:hypothetical protein [Propionibacteriaceae bacterium]
MLLLSDTSRWSGLAHDHLRRVFRSVDWYPWDYGEEHTRYFQNWSGCDLLFAFKADQVVPSEMLNKVRELAVNFHPSLPDYRGIGGYRYALDESRAEFGATCHLITLNLDGGPILGVDRFAVPPGESEECLRERTAAVALTQFHRVTNMISHKRTLVPDCREQWGEHLYTRHELERYLQEQLTPRRGTVLAGA